jgi:hypothetical protein
VLEFYTPENIAKMLALLRAYPADLHGQIPVDTDSETGRQESEIIPGWLLLPRMEWQELPISMPCRRLRRRKPRSER